MCVHGNNLPRQDTSAYDPDMLVFEQESVVVGRGGHANPHLPGYARLPLLVLEGMWREARRILEPPDTPDFTSSGRVRAFYLGTLARAQGDAGRAWRCVREAWPDGPAAEAGERFGFEPLRLHLLAANLALGCSPLQAARHAREIAGEAVRRGRRDLGAGAGPVDAVGIDPVRVAGTASPLS